jgi:asparagine synthetase B (glutamine-hydrolysing)
VYDKTESWLSEIFEKNSHNFIRQTKGNFILIRFGDDEFEIYSDRFGVIKYFYWVSSRAFIITSNLELITKNVSVKPSPASMAIFAVTYHFVGKNTFFSEVYHNKPAEIIKYKNDSLSIDYYWEPSSLLSLKGNGISIKEISDELSLILSEYFNISGTARLSLSLTGGGDTRNLLAVFLKNGIYPHLYTYGNPFSSDCIKAKKITEALNLSHSIYDIEMDSTLFQKYSRHIIKISGGLTSLHRSHRLIAIEMEKLYADYMFLGTLGGEFIKGVSENDYIVPALVYNNWNAEFVKSENLDQYFKAKYLNNDSEIKEQVFNLIKDEPYLNGGVEERKLNALSFITAHLHDAQDINVFSSVMKDIFTPFLDIDYLEILFSSCYTFNNKNISGIGILNKIDNPLFSANFIQFVYPELNRFRYSGEQRGTEILRNKYLGACLKILRQKTGRKYKANFPLGKWMEEFVNQNLPLCYDYHEIKATFDLNGLSEELRQNQTIHKENESYWLKYTNPILMRYIIESF